MVRLFASTLFFFVTSTAFAQNADVRKIQEKFEAAQPTADQMAVYQHDWTADLSQALARAKQEKRPIFFIGNTNISGPTNFYSGHC